MPVYDKSAYDQAQRNSELQHHQAFAQRGAAGTRFGGLPFSTFTGSKADRKKAGYKPEAKPVSKPISNKPTSKAGFVNKLESSSLPETSLKTGSRISTKAKASNTARKLSKTASAQKLPDKLRPVSAGNFPDPDFLGPAGGAGGSQVHKIDAGNNQDKNPDNPENENIVDVAVRLHFVIEVGMQVNIF